MKRDLKDFLRLIQFPLILALGLVPVPMLIFTYLLPGMQAYAWILPAGYFLLTVISFFIPGKLRLPYSLVAAAGLLLPWFYLLEGEFLGLSLAVALIFALLLLWSVRMAGWNKEKELHSAWIGICLCIQILGQVILFLDLKTVQHSMKAVAPWFYVSFFGTVILSMLCMSRKGLNSVITDNSGATWAMRRKNVVLVFAMVIVAAVFSLLPSAWGLIKSAFKGISALLKLLEQERPLETLPSITIPSEDEVVGELPQIELNVGLHTEILNISFQIFFAVMVIIGLPLVLCLFWKRISVALKGLWKGLISYAAESMADYEDEITDTRETVIEDETQSTGFKRKRIFSDRGMSNTEKIRHRYRQLQNKNPQWHQASTARENLPESSAAIYERARYSPHPITAADADQFKSGTKKL